MSPPVYVGASINRILQDSALRATVRAVPDKLSQCGHYSLADSVLDSFSPSSYKP